MTHAPAFDPSVLAGLSVPIKRLCADSRRVRPGDVFAASPGERTDGRAYIPQALAAGAAGVLWETGGFQWNPQWRVPNLGIAGLSAKLGLIAAHVYGDPSRNMWVGGVTGTNGKTSCTHWIAQSLGTLGRPTAVIGTLGSGFPGALRPAAHTTPDAVSVQQDMAEWLTHKAAGIAMEVSSHGLDQGRVNGAIY
jgi:UDP-N-acetylmuramoyl-L-alanyl-D-glutamate--2,6-diaminopimelate ligase